MKKTTIAMVFLAITLCGTLLFIGKRIESVNKDYVTKEKELVEIAKIYVAQGKLDLSEDYELTTSQMVTDGYIENVNVGEDTCSGYVLIKNKGKDYTYKPYIKCTNYETIID